MNDRSSMIKMGKHISDLRKSKGYTQKTLGDILDVSDKTVSKWEKGVVAPDITLLNSLAKTLDVSVEELLIGEEVNKVDTVEAIDIYSKMTKRKLIKYFTIFFLLFLLSVFFVFLIEDYYSWKITSLYSNDNISSKGFIISNNKESKIVISEIGVDNNIDNIKSISLVIKNNEEIIYNESINIETNKSILEILDNYTISIDYKRKIKKEDLQFIILYIDEYDNEKTLSIIY